MITTTLSSIFLGIVLFLTVLIALPILLLMAVLHVLTGGRRRQHGAPESEETQLMQNLHQGMTRMEGRIEALETILLERERKDGDQ